VFPAGSIDQPGEPGEQRFGWEKTMDKHNKHHKTKAKGSSQTLSPQSSLSVSAQSIGGKVDEPTVSAQKSKPAKGKLK
jgi:hypothetical protein